MEENKRDVEAILRVISDQGRASSEKFRESELEFEIGEERVEEKTEQPLSAIEDEEPEETNIFDIAEKAVGEEINEEVFKIKAPYVPRFTDVSEKYATLGYVPEEEKKSSAIKPLILGDGVDPTAELDKGVKDAKIVRVNEEKGAIINETATLFKFDEVKKEIEEAPLEPFEEEEAPAVCEPLPEESAVVSEPAVEPEAPEEEEKEPELIDIEEPLSNKMPEIYVPKNVAKKEKVTGVGDRLYENSKSEFTSPNKRDGVKDGFLDSVLSKKLRLIVAFVLSFALLVFENVRIFGVDLISLFHFEGMTNALAVIDLEFVICLAVIALPEIVLAVKSLSGKTVKAELMLVPAFAAYLFYSLVIIIKSPLEYSLFGSLFALFVLSSIIASYFRTLADFESFKVASKPGEKKIVDNKLTRTLDEENMALDGVIEEYKSKTVRVFKTSFVADFFRRTKSAGESPAHVALLTLVPFGVALTVGLISYFVASGLVSMATSFALTLLISLPALAILSRKLPHYKANLEGSMENGALIGENAYFDYAGVDVVTFSDTELFSAEDVNIQRIRLYKSNEDLTKALRQMSALFMNVGGPLDEIFSSSLDRKISPANGISIRENGLIGEIDGKKVMAGSYEFMLSEGAEFPSGEEDEHRNFDATTVMYAAENGVVYAKFYIRYRFSEEFTMLLPTLGEENIVPLVYTRDPNLTNALFVKLTAGTSKVKILKKNTTPGEDIAHEKISAGMISNGDKSNLVNLILLSRRYVKLNSFLKMGERCVMVAGLAFGAVLSLLGASAIPSLFLSLWHVSLLAALGLISKKCFKSQEKVHKNKKDIRKNAK